MDEMDLGDEHGQKSKRQYQNGPQGQQFKQYDNRDD